MMTRFEVHFVDRRPGAVRVPQLVGIEDTESAAHDCAGNVARGAARALGIGGCATEVPGMRFEVHHNGAHVIDVTVTCWA